MTNINDPWPNDEVTRRLNDLPEVDPPSTMVQDVMAAIANHRVSATHSVIPTKRGENMAKKLLWIVAAAAALALVAMRIVGYPPVEKGTEATIGAAQRYQAPQIASADVKTGDAQLQAFLQSDLFRQLATDKVAQQALKNKDFQRALQDATVRAALASSDARYAIAAVKKAAGDARVDLVNDAAIRAALDANAAFKAAFDASAALRAALASSDVVAAMANASLGAALARPEISMALSTDAAIGAVLEAAKASMDAAAAKPRAAGDAARDAAAGAARN